MLPGYQRAVAVEPLLHSRWRLPAFLQSNLHFKVFLVMMAVFPDAYATDTVRSLMTPQRDELRYRVRDIVRHMFFAAQIRQNEFRISYEPPVIPSEAAWMFHIIQGPEETTDGHVAHAQAGFLLGAALSTFLAKKKSGNEAHLDFPEYDANHWISANFAYRGIRRLLSHRHRRLVGRHLQVQRDYRSLARDWNRGDSEEPFMWTHHAHSCLVRGGAPRNPSRSSDSLAAGDAVRAAGFKATLQAVESVIKKTATRRSMRVLRARMGETQGPPDDFFVKEEERVLSELMVDFLPLSINGGLCSTPIVSSFRPLQIMPPWAWLANYRHYLERLLLSVEELSDPHWEPDTSIDVFLQARVRPAVYFLQRCAVGEGRLQGPLVDIPSSEKEELRLLALRLAGTVRFLSRVRVYRGLVDTALTLPLLLQDAPGISLENYRVLGCAANMMSIIMVLLGRLCDVEDRDRQALSICSPILQEFCATAVATARLDHTDTEYPQFHRNGLLQELFYEIDLVPEE
ncbi:hypothetical protein B0H13DRAFT_2381916 [Mycena leptocephala]|nr:hypothetical protein B0H13DRAFT_2381916 [Mycena leptocephala]